MRVIYQKIRHARYLYIKRNVEKVWGARCTLGARYLSKNMVIKTISVGQYPTVWIPKTGNKQLLCLSMDITFSGNV
jgi:hypothetical protein